MNGEQVKGEGKGERGKGKGHKANGEIALSGAECRTELLTKVIALRIHNCKVQCNEVINQ